MIYFIQSASGGPIKIGYSENVRARLKQLQTGAAEQYLLLAYMDGGKSDEEAIHFCLAEHRVRGEWFQPHDDVLEYVLEAVRKCPQEGAAETVPPYEPAEDHGEFLRAAVSKRGITHVVNVTGLTPRAVRNILVGESKISFDALVEWLRADKEFRAEFFQYCGGHLENSPEFYAGISQAFSAYMVKTQQGMAD